MASDAGMYDVIVTNQFNSVTSAPATLTVQGPAPVSLTQARVTGTNFTFTFPTESGFTYVTEYRTNLISGSWLPLVTNAGTGSSVTVTNPGTGGSARFFRVRVQ